MVVTTAIRGDRRLLESSENNVGAQQYVENSTGTEPIQKVTEKNIAQNEEDEGRGEEKSELLINYDNIDTVEKQNILEKIVELMKTQLAEPPNQRRIDRLRLKEKTKPVDEVIESVQTSIITEDNKLTKCEELVITQLLGTKEIKKQEERRTILEKKN